VPGYPVSAALTGEILVEPLLAAWQGRRPTELPTMQAELTRKTTSPLGDDDYVRVVVGKVGERVLAAPIQRGAGVISSLVRADGLVVFPAGSQGQAAGASVTVHLYRPTAEIERTILAIGSHDMALDVLAQFLAGHGRKLASANVGSLGGLVALRRGEAHLAGVHLLDGETGTYNTPFLPHYLPDTPITLVTLVGRQQGLIVPAGNPHQLQGLADVAEQGVRFVNRQRGAGTRLLLDYHLAQLGIHAEQVRGYEQEEYTHLAVAAAVASGRAACGLGIPAAAHALGLDFVPLFQERYDLAVPTPFYESEHLRPLWEILQTAAFRHAIAALPGYDVAPMGQVVSA
jgi:putative molybdopterin biosynthesis protein